MDKYILSIDQGTTSTRAILFDKSGHNCFQAVNEINCLYPHSGWVEQDALEIWVSVINVINEVLIKSNLTMKNIDSIGITNQRETTVIWDKETGLPVYHAIVWQSRQSLAICEKVEPFKEQIHKKTGLLLNPYFSASKIRFILDEIKGQERAENGELLFGTVDSWILYKMTKGEVHSTDVTNASRTMLFNIFDMKWDDDLLKLFNIPKNMLPSVKPSSHKFGDAKFFKPSVPVCGIAGDQQAALFGQTCFNTGELKNTYGTGCFCVMNTGEKPVLSENGLLTTVAWQVDGLKPIYALEGSVFVGGAAVQWLRDEMKLIKTAADSERSAMEVKDSEGVYVVPAFVGLGTPYWDSEARGAVFGLTRGTTKYHFVRATLESIAFQTKDVIEVMAKEANLELKTLRVDGGATTNGYLMQFQADILDAVIKLPQCLETTALGVAYFAGLCTGYWKDCEEIKQIHTYQAIYKPQMGKKEVQRRYEGWKKAVAATRMFK